MKVYTWVLILLLSIGWNCDICDCPDIAGEYFDIQNMEIAHYQISAEEGIKPLASQEEVKLENYYGLQAKFEVNYISNSDFRCRGFSLMPAANACDCVSNGDFGSKEERLQSLTVITLNDFDAGHPANDTINELMTVGTYGDPVDLNTFLSQSTERIRYQQLILKPKKTPDVEPFRMKVILEVSGNERYEKESEAILLVE